MNGIIIIDKPKGFTSHNVVSTIRKTLNIKKVGHIGTLDPNATGVLPILIGEATKTSKYLIEHDKKYIACLKLGEKRTTGDSEGEILEKKEITKKSRSEIEEVLKSFEGKITQIPPLYSAIKINGKKAYEYARNGEKIELKSREIEIYNIELQQYFDEEIIIEVTCSKGTYIRTLCEDIAAKTENLGYMKELRRLKVGKFDIEKSIDINSDRTTIENNIIEVENVFNEKKKINLSGKQLKLFLNGVKLNIDKEDEVYRIYENGVFIGLGVVKDGTLKRDIIFYKEEL